MTDEFVPSEASVALFLAYPVPCPLYSDHLRVVISDAHSQRTVWLVGWMVSEYLGVLQGSLKTLLSVPGGKFMVHNSVCKNNNPPNKTTNKETNN